MLSKRHGKRCFWDTRTIAHLGYKQVIACEQTLLQRTGWNHIVLEEEQVDEIHNHQRIHPRHHEADRTFRVTPPLPTYLFGDIYIIDKGQDNESPPTLYPQQEQQVQYSNTGKLSPLHLHIQFGFFLINHNLLEFKHVTDGEQSRVLVGIFSSKHRTHGKALTTVRIVRNRDFISIAVIGDTVYTGHFSLTDTIYTQLVVSHVLASFHGTVSIMHLADVPSILVIQVVHDFFCQRNRSATGMIQFMNMMHLLHRHLVLREAVHNFGQVTVYRREDSHTDGEVTSPEERLSALAAHLAHLVALVFHPSGTTRHHLHIFGKSFQIISVRCLRGSKFDGHISTGKGSTVKVFLIIDVDDTHNIVNTVAGNLLYHLTHLSVAD